MTDEPNRGQSNPLADAIYPAPKEVISYLIHVMVWFIHIDVQRLCVGSVFRFYSKIHTLPKEIIDPIIEYRDEEGYRVENPFTDQILVKIIFDLPKESIPDDYFEFIMRCLQSKYDPVLISGEIGDKILPKLIESNSNEFLLSIVEIVLSYKKSDSGTFEEYSSVMGRYYLHVILEKHLNSIIQNAAPEAINIALKKVDEIILDDPSQFNIVWIPSIKESNDFQRYDSQIIHVIWSGIMYLGPENNHETIASLLEKEHPIFKRIAFCEIDNNYDFHKDLFWGIAFNPLEDYYLKYEIYELIKNNCSKFTDKEIERVISWIESREYKESKFSDLDQLNAEKYIAYKKKEWLSALLPSGKSSVLELYNQYDTINPSEVKYPRAIVEHISAEKSPFTKEELLLKPNEELVIDLNNFREEGQGLSRISADALWEVFRQSVIENPKKIVNNIDPFSELKWSYLQALIIGLDESWRKETDFSWETIFPFIISIIESTEFWSETNPEDRINYRNGIISGIADLIEGGTQKDIHTFDLTLLPHAKKILLILDEKCESDLFDMGDIVTSVLNSQKGKIFSAMINYSLCEARHNRKDIAEKWDVDIRERFTKHLNDRRSIEFFETLGKYFLNICYLDKNWIQEHINEIFPKMEEQYWKAAFTGYLFYSRLWIKAYNFLKTHGHYSKAITTTFSDPHITERLIQHIVITYFEGIENINDEQSLISQVISQWEPKQINEIVRYVPWVVKDHKTEKFEELKALWKKIFSETLLAVEVECNIKILSALNEWISIIDEVDNEVYELLNSSIKYLDPYHSEIIEQFNRLVGNNPAYVGKIFLTMTESGRIFPFARENVRMFIVQLYDQGEIEIANKICATHLKFGYDFLDDIYEVNLENQS